MPAPGLSRPREKRGARRLARAAHRNALLDAILSPDATLPSSVRGFAPARAWLALQKPEVKHAARSLLSALADHCPDALLARTYRHEIGASVIVRAAAHATRMIRGVDDFQPPPRRVVEGLLLHLFARYPVPRFVVTTMIQPGTSLARRGSYDVTPPALLAHIGQGGSFQTASLPIHVTRAIAHALSTSCAQGPRLALRAAQLSARGIVLPTLAATLAQSAFGSVDEEAFLDRFLELLQREPMEAGDAMIVFAWCAHQGASFSFSGRTARALLEEVRDDARRGGRFARHFGFFPPCMLVCGDVDVGTRTWTVRYIASGAELANLAREMRNCAGGYADGCATGYRAMFQATPKDASTSSGVTIEVSLRERKIVQAKAFANAAMSAEARAAVVKWASTAGIQMGV